MDRRDLAEWLCILLIAFGVAWVYPPAGLITLGVLGLCWFVWGVDEEGTDGAE